MDELGNNNRVDANDYWCRRLFVTIDPRSDCWVEAIDFNEDGMACYADHLIF